MNQGKTVATLLRIFPYAKKALPRISLGIVAAVAAHGFALAIPQVLRDLINDLESVRTLDALYFSVFLVLIMGILEAVMVLLRRWLVLTPGTFVEAGLRSTLYAKLQDLPVSFHDRWPSGQLLSRATQDLSLIRRWLSFGVVLLVANGITIIAGLIILFTFHWLLGLIFFVISVPIWIQGYRFEAKYGTIARLSQDQAGDLATSVEESTTDRNADERIGGRIARFQQKSRLTIIPGGPREDLRGVAHPQQAKALGRRGLLHRVAGAAAPAVQKRFDLQAALPHGHQLAHQQAHHAVEKAAGLHFGDQQIPLAIDAHVLNGGAGMGAAAAGPLEGGEVVFPQQSLQTGGHAGLVEAPLVAVPAPGRQEQVGGAAVEDRVAVAPVGGAEAGVPVGGHFGGGPHPDRGRQAAVEGLRPAGHGDGATGVEMHHLGRGMDAAVGATRGHRLGGPVRVKRSDGPFQGFLNAAVAGLTLPAVERGALVLQRKGDPFQTSSMIAISALSPRRRTVRMMRV